jgi:hypothetical protein
MIDTTAWRTKLTKAQLDNILKRSKEYSEYDHENKTTGFRILRSNTNIGSYDSNITIKCYDGFNAYLEFSLPKQYLGNNVELLYPRQIEEALTTIYENIVERYGDFPHYKKWLLQRLDLCYAWRFLSQSLTIEILKILKTFDYPRKNKYLYKESVMWRGRTYSIKFYLKNDEFLSHDYRKLIKLGKIDFAKKIAELSDGVLRFEITLRKQALDYLFKKKDITYQDLLSQEFLEKILQRYLNTLTMNLDKSVMDDNEVLKRLQETYPSRKAIRLFAFFKTFNSEKLNQKQILKDNYHASTIWRNKNDLSLANIGLPSHTKPITFSLDIPSDLVVNT